MTPRLSGEAEFFSWLSAAQVTDANSSTPLFAEDQPVWVARAPGRLDVLGGIADYCGALVLELPIAEATYAGVQRRADDELCIVSVTLDTPASEAREARLSLTQLRRATQNGYQDASEFLSASGPSWLAYVAGAIVVLEREVAARLDTGLSVLLASEVPEGKGVSSSAALEVATLQAMSAALGQPLQPLMLAELAQRIEHSVVGAPCGIMDQVTVALGHRDRLVELLCQPASVQGMLSVPAELRFFGIDSGVRHAVSGADYGQVRCAAFMGYRMLAELEGLQVEVRSPGRVVVNDPVYGGYLANVPVSVFEQRYREHLPARMLGAEFLERYFGTTDPATSVDPTTVYPVRAATAHPVYEHQRTRLFRKLLSAAADLEVARLLGELMFQSHVSYNSCGLGSSATDELVRLARQAGPERGIFGAKITGGGSGGTVALLARADAHEQVSKLAAQYAEQHASGGRVFEGSSLGACEYGVRAASFGDGQWRFA